MSLNSLPPHPVPLPQQKALRERGRTNKDLLIEIGTEELPAKGLEKLAQEFAAYLKADQYYVTPRRLAVLIKNVPDRQPDSEIERKGPAITAPQQAQEGFAKSCGVPIDQLTIKDGYLFHTYMQVGKTVAEYMPALVEEALRKIPTGKTMRWGDHPESFIRPIHWILMIHGDKIVPGKVFDISIGNITYGHRFHYPKPITIKKPAEYEAKLKDKKVIVDFIERRDKIQKELHAHGWRPGSIDDPDPVKWQQLLHEVTNLVEWPVVLKGTFDKKFLDVPKEALISAMQEHQKCFPVEKHHKLDNSFIIVSNIESTKPETVIHGNERVMRARLADAEFFYLTDCKRTLENRLEDLKTVTFQAKLGSLYDKSKRIEALSAFIAPLLGADITRAKRAGLLCKADLTSGMVGEFPELQGIMGGYYAQHDKEPKEVADAIREHYRPRFAVDDNPQSDIGTVISLADRFDTLVGIFGINQQPTGDKDPFALRRAAIGIINILWAYDLDFHPILQKAIEAYGDKLPNKQIEEQVAKFILERMRAGYIAKEYNNNMFNAVAERVTTQINDFDKRIRAVKAFAQLPQASSLAAANKRVSNILIKEKQDNITGEPNPKLFEHPSEKILWDAILSKKDLKGDYAKTLTSLADLQAPVDQFFNDVMVMADDEALRMNRLRLLNYLRQLFLQVADISLL